MPVNRPYHEAMSINGSIVVACAMIAISPMSDTDGAYSALQLHDRWGAFGGGIVFW